MEYPMPRPDVRRCGRQPPALEAAGHLADPALLVLRDADSDPPRAAVCHRGRVAMAEMLPTTRWGSWLARPGRDWFHFPSSEHSAERRLGWRPAVIPLAVILAAVVFQGAGVRAALVGRGWVSLDQDHWPIELLPELHQAERRPQRRRIFNDFLFGGFLIYYTPALKVPIDDRSTLWRSLARDSQRPCSVIPGGSNLGIVDIISTTLWCILDRFGTLF